MISTPSRDASLYTQQREENEKHLCQLAARKITVATLVGGGEFTLRHHQLGRERWLNPPSAHVHGRIHGVCFRGGACAQRPIRTRLRTGPDLAAQSRTGPLVLGPLLHDRHRLRHEARRRHLSHGARPRPVCSLTKPLTFLPQRVFEAPPAAPALFQHIDNFPSRRSEKEKERKNPPPCSQRHPQPGADNSLLR